VVLAVVELKVADARRERALRAFGAARGRPALALICREERVAVLGQPIYRYATTPTAADLRRAVARLPQSSALDLIVSLPRDVPLDTGQVESVLDEHPGPVTLIVPSGVLTGGLTLARVADELLLGPEARFAEGAEPPIAARELVVDEAGGRPRAGGLPDGLGAVLACFALAPRHPRGVVFFGRGSGRDRP
jgi:hypothetical protein